MNEILGVLPFFYLNFEASNPQFKFQKFKHDAHMEASIGQARTRDVTQVDSPESMTSGPPSAN